MKKSWLTLILVVVIVVVGIVVFNYQAKKQSVSLSEIFPDEGASPSDVEYEFIKKDDGSQQMPAVTTTSTSPTTASKTQASQTAPAMTAQGTVSKQTAQTAPVMAKETVTSSKLPFSIQIGSFKEEKKAQQALQELQKKQYSGAFVLQRDLKDKGMWYRVYIGQFETKSAAENSLTQVKNDYKDSFIVMLPK